MPAQSKVSLPVIKRLPKYYRYLVNLSADGREKVSSSELAHMMGTTASQVRQDFNCFGGFGQQGIGYKVNVLLDEIGRLLFGNGELLPTILIGAGRLDWLGRKWQALSSVRWMSWNPSVWNTSLWLQCCVFPGKVPWR